MRNITEIIIHCTDTYPNQKVTVADIDRWHREQDYNGIGYHYVIDRNGEIHQGRDPERAGAHCKGHNRYSLGIAYIGGRGENGLPADTRTPDQKIRLSRLVRALKILYPLATVHGHNEFNPAKACPCFDVKTEFPTINH